MTSASANTPAVTMAPHKDICGPGGREAGGIMLDTFIGEVFAPLSSHPRRLLLLLHRCLYSRLLCLPDHQRASQTAMAAAPRPCSLSLSLSLSRSLSICLSLSPLPLAFPLMANALH